MITYNDSITIVNMKITFENIRWRFEDDDEVTLRIPFGVKNANIGELKRVTYDDESGECKVYGVLNTFGFHCYAFRHQTQGLERTTLLFATPDGAIGEFVLFPGGKVAVVIEHYAKAPEWAINKQKQYCI